MAVPEGLVAPLLRLTRANRTFSTRAGAQRQIDQRAVRPKAFGPPRLLRRDVNVAVTHRDGWPVYTVTPTRVRPAGCLVYAHGGGWVNEIAPQHWQLAAQIAAEAGTTVIVPIYPLVPFGTAAKVNAGFVELATQARAEHGVLCLAGDSAGGQIALSTALSLHDQHGVTAATTILISPALDLSISNPAVPAVLPSDPWLGLEGTRHLIDAWRADLPLHDPRVSPLAGDLTGLGPLSVYIGTRDILWPDTRLLRDRARAAGVAVELQEEEGLVHVYPLLPTRSGRAARERIVATVRAALNGADQR